MPKQIQKTLAIGGGKISEVPAEKRQSARNKVDASASTHQEYRIGESILFGKFVIEKILGKGNFGHVYQVKDARTGTMYALKHALDQKTQKALEEELRLLLRLKDAPHTLRLHDYYHDKQGNLVLTTELLGGGNLKEEVIQRSRFTEAEGYQIVGEIGQALAYAHALEPPILHKDVKPDNIIAQRYKSGRMEWFLGDWGLASDTPKAEKYRPTGTQGYTAPEVWEGKRDPASDIYSLGMTLYRLLFGKVAFPGKLKEIRKGHIEKEVPIPAGTPTGLKDLLLGMLEKDPAKRWSLEQVLRYVGYDGRSSRRVSISMTRQIKPGKTWMADLGLIHMPFQWIPGGTFMMGQNDQEQVALKSKINEETYNRWYARECPCHPVSLTGFWMSRYPVTVDQFRLFVDATGHVSQAEQDGWAWCWRLGSKRFEKVKGASWKDPGFPQRGDHPAVCISYYDACAMANWLTKKCLRDISLPTEAQWERACRADVDGAYPGGDTLVDSIYCRAVAGVIGTGSIQRANAFINKWGLVDIGGHIWEWTRDRFQADFYKQSRLLNPVCLSSAKNRVIRGAGWSTANVFNTRCAFRDKYGPKNSDNDIGFRLVALSFPWES
ncbi:MAG: SUMF1/EgtB/PvdO family nonheme iron enzyme [Magnetococcales bacterium]|nr:SUMF1/EgtB/PvdO family nonheme iron enzyme [Magnetococcales bacterium]